MKILPVDINHREVGVHHILSRFLTELICRYPEEITFLSREETILYCTEALACQALECQHKAGFWKKNGTSLTYTLHYYTNISHGFNFFAVYELLCMLLNSTEGFYSLFHA